jgi:hypothetical protein
MTLGKDAEASLLQINCKASIISRDKQLKLTFAKMAHMLYG